MSDTDSGRESPMPTIRSASLTTYRHPKLIDNDRNTQLHYLAAKNDVTGITNYLNNESPVVDPENYFGWTPLMMACRKGHFEAMKVLLRFKANATKQNKYGMYVFQLAVASGNLALIEHLLEHLLTGGVSRRVLEHTFPITAIPIIFNNQKVLEFLVEKYFDINATTLHTGITPFMFAHALEHDTFITILLKNQVDTKKKNYLGHTAVDIATIRQNMKLMSRHKSQSEAPKIVTTTEESIQNEIQNQQLRNALQLKPLDTNNIVASPSVFTSPAQNQIPCIILTPISFSNPQVTYLTASAHARPRLSSNISPSTIPPTPNVTPIYSAVSTGNIAAGQQFFFPPNFSPNHSVLSLSSHQAYNTVTSQSYSVTDFMNSRINSSVGMYSYSPFVNVISPNV
ncbi:uncharacterized protein LOC126745830 [Anthonomus grandis grandis]|uniref:uncharacterized protein LOC126745830 n=1 Tax=Anthonomus grandis grandis TaxID=2921223 RepID=UPI00216545A4|nr:uncharacterized protein LOC126745830 [Anthonomus grandis grandis]